MLSLSNRELREFGIRGYVVIRNVIPPAILRAASMEIDRLVNDQPRRKVQDALLDDGSLVAVFSSACLDACSFSSDCGNNIYHFLTRATLIVSHAML